MRFSKSAILLAIASLGSHVLAAPTSSATAIQPADLAAKLEQSVTSMASNVGKNLASMNSTAKSSGFMALPSLIKNLQTAAESFTETQNTILPLISSNPIADFSIEEIQQLIKVLEVYKNVLSTVEQTVDAVVNAFFPGLVDFFKPFIQIWINVVDSFTTPFLTFYTNLVGSLSGSPELAKVITDYIAQIKEIRDDFLLSF